MRKMMISMIVVGALIWGLASFCWSRSTVDSYQMRKLAYTSAIDAKIAFYKKRLYLLDSEYPVLVEIGRNAARRIHFLKTYKVNLIEEMMTLNLPLRVPKMKLFLFKKMKNLDLIERQFRRQL